MGTQSRGPQSGPRKGWKRLPAEATPEVWTDAQTLAGTEGERDVSSEGLKSDSMGLD